MRCKFKVDGNDATISIGNLELTHYSARVEGCAVPAAFARFALNKQTKADATRLVRESQKALTDPGKCWPLACWHLLNEVAEKGLEMGWRLIEQARAAAPNGKPHLYQSLIQDPSGDRHVTITDGVRAYRFPTPANVKRLPVNFYCSEAGVRCRLEPEALKTVKQDVTTFFAFVDKTAELRRATSWTAMDAIISTFFSDRKRAYEMLDNAELWRRFLQSAVQCPQGYLCFNASNHGQCWGYLITFKGEVRVFSRREEVVQETVERAVKHGAPITGLHACAALTVLERKKLAKAVGTLNPAVALLLL